MIEFIKKALISGQHDDYIVPGEVIKYVDIFSIDRRYKLFWLASNCYKKGCSSGIIQYRNSKYYFQTSGSVLNVERI